MLDLDIDTGLNGWMINGYSSQTGAFRLSKNGLHFYVQSVPYCCGITLIYGLETLSGARFGEEEVIAALKDMHGFLTEREHWQDLTGCNWDNDTHVDEHLELLAYNLRRSKFVMYDAVGGEEGTPYSLWRLAQGNGWTMHYDDAVKNSNSGNDIISMEYNQPEDAEDARHWDAETVQDLYDNMDINPNDW